MTTLKPEKTEGVIPYLPEEIDHFESEVERFRHGEVPEADFVGFRLKQGVYGQRQADAQMIRIKIPFGGMTADQLDAMAYLAEEYTPLKKGHITTRENIQMHHIELDRTPEFLRVLGDVGLTTREACGNTVRNVVGCAKAGVCAGEAFDPTPYLAAYARYFVRHPITQLLPRKFKSAFSGCAHDCAMTAIHDMGLVATVKDGKRGFKMVVGGGTSIMARIAPTLYEFVSVEDYLKVVEAVLRVFNKSDELRKNRMKARIKFLVDRIGIDEFRKLVEEELQEPWAQQKIDPTPYMYLGDEEADAPPAPPNARRANGHPTPELERWLSTNVAPQKQEGYRVVYVTVPQGDLTPEKFRGLASLSRTYAGGRCRITQEQGLVFRWVREESLVDVYEELTALGLGEPGYREITDVTTCPGTDSCKMGITSAMGLGEAVRETLLEQKIEDPRLREMAVKISGCPNGCGLHHIANIGFHGAAIKGASGQQVPAYEVFVGGNPDGARGPIRIGQRVKGRVPAKRAPEFIKRALDMYMEQRQDGEPFNDFVARAGATVFEPLLEEYRQVGALGKDTIDLYMDWSKDILYKLERGEGECAV